MREKTDKSKQLSSNEPRKDAPEGRDQTGNGNRDQSENGTKNSTQEYVEKRASVTEEKRGHHSAKNLGRY